MQPVRNNTSPRLPHRDYACQAASGHIMLCPTESVEYAGSNSAVTTARTSSKKQQPTQWCTCTWQKTVRFINSIAIHTMQPREFQDIPYGQARQPRLGAGTRLEVAARTQATLHTVRAGGKAHLNQQWGGRVREGLAAEADLAECSPRMRLEDRRHRQLAPRTPARNAHTPADLRL